MVPWTRAADGSIRQTEDPTSYSWPRSVDTGLNRPPIGWLNETDVAMLVSSEEAAGIGRGVMVHASAGIGIDALPLLRSLVRDTERHSVNATMRGIF
jgi:hypothetical protein